MTTLTIQIPDDLTLKVTNFIEDLGGEVIKQSASKKELKKALLDEIEQGFIEALDIRDGKIARTTLKESLRD